MFYFRADANKEIATGHIMRCMSIADELRKRNINSTFITADNEAEALIRSRGYERMCLNSCWSSLEAETDKLIGLIEERSIDKIIIDSYYASDTYFEKLSKHTKVIYIDDLGKINFPVNTIINYSSYAETLGYQQQFGKSQVNLILGGQYVPLREEFQLAKPAFRENIKTVLVSTGGGDICSFAGSLLDCIAGSKKYNPFHFIVISGKYNPHYEQLKKQCEHISNITILQNVQEMSKLMLQADIAVTAGGSTMYELCACEVPMLVFTFADNQLAGAKDFAKRKAAFYAGDVRESRDRVISRILNQILYLAGHWEDRYKLIKNAALIVNKNGAVNLVDQLLKI